MIPDSSVGRRWELLHSELDERQRRLLVAAEAKVLGHGGISAVSVATGVSRSTIMAGLDEFGAMRPTDYIAEGLSKTQTRMRRKGGGRKKIELKDESLLADLLTLVDPVTRGDPQSPLRWTCKSLRTLADQLKTCGQ